MKKWSIYKKDTGEIEAVKDGFNWFAFFFVGLWAFTKGLTLAGVIGLSLTVMANRMPPNADIIAIPITVILMLVYGFMGNNWVAAKLEKQEYSLLTQIEAASADGAKATINKSLTTTQNPRT